jgi:hypothetical protein
MPLCTTPPPPVLRVALLCFIAVCFLRRAVCGVVAFVVKKKSCNRVWGQLGEVVKAESVSHLVQ